MTTLVDPDAASGIAERGAEAAAPVVVVAGDFAPDQMEENPSVGLERNGATVHGVGAMARYGRSAFLRRGQPKYVAGPGVCRVLRNLVEACAQATPTLLIGRRTAWLDPAIIERCRKAVAKAVTPHNNDRFVPDRLKHSGHARPASPVHRGLLPFQPPRVFDSHKFREHRWSRSTTLSALWGT